MASLVSNPVARKRSHNYRNQNNNKNYFTILKFQILLEKKKCYLMANPVTELIGADGYLNLKKFFKHPLVKQVVNINLNLPISVLRWLPCALNS